MKKIFILIFCLLMLPFWNVGTPVHAVTKAKNSIKSSPKNKKQSTETETPNLVNDPTFSTFNQEEQNSWVYAINGGRNTRYTHMPLLPAGGGYDIPDGEGGPIVGHVEQTDFEGTKGVKITNTVASASPHTGQLMTGLKIGEYYTFSIDVKANKNLTGIVSLRSKKIPGRVVPDIHSTNYLTSSDGVQAPLKADQWKTLNYTFQAKEETAYFDFSFATTSLETEIGMKHPVLQNDQLPEGFEPGTRDDTIKRSVGGDNLALIWNRTGYTDNRMPMLTNNGNNYAFRGLLDINLVIDKTITLGGENYGGVFSSNIDKALHIFAHTENSLYQAFHFTDNNSNHYKLEVFQTFQADGSALIDFTVHNLTDQTLRMGLLHYVTLFAGSNGESYGDTATPINGFKGLSLQYYFQKLTILPDNFENWSIAPAGSYGFKAFTPQTADGLGWESGFQNGDSTKPLEEDVPVKIGYSSLSMKTVNKEVSPNNSISFKQVLKYGEGLAPDFTLDQAHFSINRGEDVIVKGQAWDPDTPNFNISLINKATNAKVVEKDFHDIPIGEKQPLALTIPAEQLKLGKNEFIARVSDQWGEKKELLVTVTVSEILQFKKVPPTLAFQQSEISPNTKLIPREDANWAIEIDNSIAKNWQVKAESTPVKDENEKVYPNALVFKDAKGNMSDLARGQQVIASGNGENASPLISWPKDQGVLFHFQPQVMTTGTYQARLIWTLENTP